MSILGKKGRGEQKPLIPNTCAARATADAQPSLNADNLGFWAQRVSTADLIVHADLYSPHLGTTKGGSSLIELHEVADFTLFVSHALREGSRP